jgi:hypothetical protein
MYANEVEKGHVNLGWSKALKDAEDRLGEAKAQVKKLEVTVQTCRDRVRSGEPWPG